MKGLNKVTGDDWTWSVAGLEGGRGRGRGQLGRREAVAGAGNGAARDIRGLGQG